MEKTNTGKKNSPIPKDSRQHAEHADVSRNANVSENAVLSEAIEVLNELPEEKKDILTNGMIVAMQQSFRGPIPPAKEMKGYLEVLPDAPDRILKMAEKEQDGRISHRKLVTILTFVFRTIGQMCGLAISLLFAWGAIRLGMEGHDGLACAMVGITLVGLVSVFVIGKLPYFNKSNKEEQDIPQ